MTFKGKNIFKIVHNPGNIIRGLIVRLYIYNPEME